MKRTRALLLPLVLLGMQACWLGIWIGVVESAVQGGRSITACSLCFMAMGMVAFLLLRRLRARRITIEGLYWLLWCLLSAVVGKLLLFAHMPWADPAWLTALPQAALRLVFETRPAELLLLAGTGVAWYLGRRSASSPLHYGRLLGDFQFGLVLILIALLLSHAVGASSHGHVLLALAFFALSLTGVALSRGEEGSDAASLLARKHFSSSLLSFVAIVSTAGLLVSIAVTPEVISAVVDSLKYVWQLIERAMAFIASLVPAGEIEPEGPPASATGDDTSLLEFYHSMPIPALLKRILYLLYVTMVAGLLLFGLWRLCGQVLEWLKRRSRTAGIELEALDAGFLSDLLALVRWLGRKLGRVWQGIRTRVNPRRTTATPTVAGLYADLLRWAGKRLRPRQPAESPYEYQAALQGLLPSAGDDLALMTQTYVCTCYGGYRAESADIEALGRASHRIRHSRRLRKPDITTKEEETG